MRLSHLLSRITAILLTRTNLIRGQETTILKAVTSIRQASQLTRTDSVCQVPFLQIVQMAAKPRSATMWILVSHTEPILADIALSIAGHVYNSHYIL